MPFKRGLIEDDDVQAHGVAPEASPDDEPVATEPVAEVDDVEGHKLRYGGGAIPMPDDEDDVEGHRFKRG